MTYESPASLPEHTGAPYPSPSTASAANPSVAWPDRIISPTDQPEIQPDPAWPVKSKGLQQHFAEAEERFASLAEGIILDIASVLITDEYFPLGGRA